MSKPEFDDRTLIGLLADLYEQMTDLLLSDRFERPIAKEPAHDQAACSLCISHTKRDVLEQDIIPRYIIIPGGPTQVDYCMHMTEGELAEWFGQHFARSFVNRRGCVHAEDRQLRLRRVLLKRDRRLREAAQARLEQYDLERQTRARIEFDQRIKGHAERETIITARVREQRESDHIEQEELVQRIQRRRDIDDMERR